MTTIMLPLVPFKYSNLNKQIYRVYTASSRLSTLLRTFVSSSAIMGISNYASADGEFRRKPSTFRNHIEIGGQYPPERGRYHLYISWACPWGAGSP